MIFLKIEPVKKCSRLSLLHLFLRSSFERKVSIAALPTLVRADPLPPSFGRSEIPEALNGRNQTMFSDESVMTCLFESGYQSI